VQRRVEDLRPRLRAGTTGVIPDDGLKVLFGPPGAHPGRGWCLEPRDLAAAKLAAGRTKDYEFVGALLDAGLLDGAALSANLR